MRLLNLLLAALLLAPTAWAAASHRIVLISGEYEYKSAETLPAFKSYLESRYPIECVYLRRPPETNNHTIPGLEALEGADLAVFFIRRMKLPESELARIKAYVNYGKPIVGIRTASHAFENWPEFDREVLGGNYGRHLQKDLKTSVTVIPEAAKHPILEGFSPFVSSGSLYRNSPLQPGTTPLLLGEIQGAVQHPVAWTHRYHGARVFYTSLGHQDDFQEESFRRLLVNGIFWALNQPIPLQLAPGITRLEPDEFARAIRSNKAILLDVRTPREVEAGRIPGSINIDFQGKNFAEEIKKLDPDQTYLVYCAGGVRSAKACEQMRKLNFKSLVDLSPGFRGWEKAGKPIEK